MIITSMSEHEKGKKKNVKVEDSRDKVENNQPFLQHSNISISKKWTLEQTLNDYAAATGV